MNNTLRTLYREPESFPNIIECMLRTQPGKYYRQTLEGQYEVAQKYGQFDGYLNNAGIIYTPTPIILVVFTYRVDSNMELFGELAQIMADYSLTLDERAAQREAERMADEEAAAAEAERQRLAAEEEAQKEAERIAEEKAQEEAARLAEEERIIREANVRAAEAAARVQRLRVITVAALFGCTALALLLWIRRQKR